MKYPSFETVPDAQVSCSRMKDGNLEGSRIGSRVLGLISSSAPLNTGAGPFVCPSKEFDPKLAKKQRRIADADTPLTQCRARSRQTSMVHILRGPPGTRNPAARSRAAEAVRG